MGKYVIGMDVGATKSHLAIFDTKANRIDFREWGPLNHEILPGSFAQLETEMNEFVTKALADNVIAPEQIEHAVFGMAGVDTKQQHSIISKMIEKFGFQNFTLCNDSFLGIPAGSSSGFGICAINGTGATIAGINKDGKMLQIGGVCALTDDKGGGRYMGERVAGAVYSALFRLGEPTLLEKFRFDALKISSKYDYLDALCEISAENILNITVYNKLVFEAARQNDKVAMNILTEIAENYASGITCMIREMEFAEDGGICIVLTGSVFVKEKDPVLIHLMQEKILEMNPGRQLNYVMLKNPPVAGAVIWALKTLNSEGFYIEKVCEQL